MNSTALNPEVLWAQRSNAKIHEKNYILLTISIPDCEDPQVSINEDSLDLTATSKGHVGDEQEHTYKLHIDFYKKIDPASKDSITKVANGRHFFAKLIKQDLETDYWPRLTKEKIKYSNIKTDFNKWVDEDEQEEEEELPMGMGGGAPGGVDMSEMLKGMDMDALKNMDMSALQG
ncbi:Hsp90 cochaperone SBA1 NDAI_0K00630 [Naumovozyma dairenensis CBS 421]|uniref:CS domain-containing protein n=1 Tax=Naumovozyma dairenensis (strain ATCC 10597 / BCRC 20456 / CBS 421 / NBRC 0211 / NRRL Y-12639) TaxID=1071378 RepID=G0WHJ3_NAUDC|nr:hypothetical protein NDAI_0K00630 [Naumovozyma dairenensis CBS 421]CCD27254.1 hypothetical protein NDAI_0K00630 [Naumovozyma dairenensis CBS 421]